MVYQYAREHILQLIEDELQERWVLRNNPSTKVSHEVLHQLLGIQYYIHFCEILSIKGFILGQRLIDSRGGFLRIIVIQSFRELWIIFYQGACTAVYTVRSSSFRRLLLKFWEPSGCYTNAALEPTQIYPYPSGPAYIVPEYVTIQIIFVHRLKISHKITSKRNFD